MPTLSITPAGVYDYDEILQVWEASVRATHHFITEADIQYYKRYIPAGLAHSTLYCIRNNDEKMIAFIGIDKQFVDTLFVHPDERGKGLGRQLIQFAIQKHKINKVDVNDQNEQALAFYHKMGFVITGRETFHEEHFYPVYHMQLTEHHPLGFYLPKHTRLLMLGSFPPPKARWSMDFYYPNIQNDMWRIMGLLFYNDKNYFLKTTKAFSLEKAKAFCNEVGIGIGDTAMEVIRLKDNASDKFLEVVRPINPEEVLQQIPECKAIVVTGQKAMDTLLSVLPPNTEEPKVGTFSTFELAGRTFKLFRMPSSSRAYPKPLPEKAEVYRNMFNELGIL